MKSQETSFSSETRAGASTVEDLSENICSKKFFNISLSFILKDFRKMSFLTVSKESLMCPTSLHLRAGTDACGPSFHRKIQNCSASHVTGDHQPSTVISLLQTQHRERQTDQKQTNNNSVCSGVIVDDQPCSDWVSKQTQYGSTFSTSGDEERK